MLSLGREVGCWVMVAEEALMGARVMGWEEAFEGGGGAKPENWVTLGGTESERWDGGGERRVV